MPRKSCRENPPHSFFLNAGKSNLSATYTLKEMYSMWLLSILQTVDTEVMDRVSYVISRPNEEAELHNKSSLQEVQLLWKQSKLTQN